MSDKDLIRIADILSEKMSVSHTSSKPPSPIKEVNNGDENQFWNVSSHNNGPNRVKNAHIRAKLILDRLDNQVLNTRDTNTRDPDILVSSADNTCKDKDRNATIEQGVSKVDDGFHFSEDGLLRFISQIGNLSEGQPGNKKRKLDQQNSFASDEQVDGPPLGAFGEIRHISSLLEMSRQRDSINDWDFSDRNNLHARLLKSGLNRSYNDLVVREIIWPNDLVLRGSEKVKLLDMTHSEFFQAVLKTIQGTLPKGNENNHARDLFCYFINMFRDAHDDSLAVTLKAHKTVMGQLEKGELTLDSGWKEWDEVRKNSVLTQTLHNITTMNNKTRAPVTNNKPSTASQSGPSGNSNNQHTSGNVNKSTGRPLVYFNSKRCYNNVDHGDNKHPDWWWVHICSWCFKNCKDRARHPESDCLFKSKDFSKNGDGPSQG